MKISEYLYLSKKKDLKVLIDTDQIVQHQIDGIRFLYQRYTMGKPGIIFNDPHTCDRTQIVLFLEALKSDLEKPALILCNKNDTSQWMEHFQQRELLDVAALEDPNPWGKKKVYIYEMENHYKISRCDWSIVIIDDDAVSKHMLKTIFRANFKIWITTLDMKNYLKVFSSVYQWIHSNHNFTPEDFNVSNNDTLSDVGNEIMLDAFPEDIVLRRNELKVSVSKKPQKASESENKNLKYNVSKKNKDVTGTKIKRTKRKCETNSLDYKNNKISKNKRRNAIHSDSEDFITNSEMNITDRAKDNLEIIDIHNKTDECKANSDFILNNEIKTTKVEDSLRTDDGNITNENNFHKITKGKSLDSFDNDYSKMIDNNAINVDFDEIKQKTSRTNESKSNFHKTCCDKTSLGRDSDFKSYENSMNEDKRDNSFNSSDNKNEITNNKAMDVDFLEMSQETMCFQGAVQDIVDHENILAAEMDHEIEVKNNIENENQHTLNVSKRISNVDSKLSELDEKIFKKFKGTLLDSIF